MKRTVILTAVCLLGLQALMAQVAKMPPASAMPYKALADCPDEVSYLNYNYKTRASYYAGMTFEQFMSELEVEPVAASALTYFTPNDIEIMKNVAGLKLMFFDASKTVTGTYIEVYWRTKFGFDAIKPLREQYGLWAWNAQVYEFYKDKVIERIVFHTKLPVTLLLPGGTPPPINL